MKFNLIMLFTLLLLFGCTKNSVNDPTDNNGKITAASKFNAVKSLASEYSEGLILKSIKSEELQSDGFAKKWNYKFSTAGIAVDYYFHATSNEVLYDSTSSINMDGEGLIANQWFDSDEALIIAENNGGKEFRNNNHEYLIEASLVEPLIPNSETIWFVKYSSSFGNTKILHLGINTITKEVGLYY
ncbi:MAG: hypothetical protein KKF62_09055 [Bacteroidetes bacterium]|nr:hypothetical protein [Bacteroidota bacterium]MBU1117139.1 hypothetical protein [Bacteroidota bacterium]MBU1796821.1 hypothetical protein [Bacteroidota bacterium]